MSDTNQPWDDFVPDFMPDLTSDSYSLSDSRSANSESMSPPDLMSQFQHPMLDPFVAVPSLQQSYQENQLAQRPLPQTDLPQSPPQTESHQDQPLVNDRPYHAKRPHKKSRNGCTNCKTRKVKCDEARPTCRSCRLRKQTCVYTAPPSATPSAGSSTSPVVSTRRPSSQSSRPPSDRMPSRNATTVLPMRAGSPSPRAALTSNLLADPVLGTFNADDDFNFLLGSLSDAGEYPDTAEETYDVTTPLIIKEPMFNPHPDVDHTDLRLLWFFSTQTASSFTLDYDNKFVSPSVEVMRSNVPRHAFGNQFLMDSIFALSAMHILNVEPTSTQVDWNRALYYRQKSFLGYRKAIEEAKPETFPALLANSLLLCALSSQTFRDPEGDDLYIIDWMIVWKGIGLIIDLISVPALIASGLDALFHRPAIDLERAATATPNHLLFMVSSIPAQDQDHADIATYYECLKHLGALYENLSRGVNAIMGLRIITFFTFVPKRFVELSRARRPRALIILAYYAMFLKLIPVVWWTVGIGQRSLKDILRHLGPEWQHLLRGPLMASQVDSPVDVARIILEDPTWVQPKRENISELERQVRALTWVDNAGRRMLMQPDRGRMVVREREDGPDLLPYFEDKPPEALARKFNVDFGEVNAVWERIVEEEDQLRPVR